MPTTTNGTFRRFPRELHLFPIVKFHQNMADVENSNGASNKVDPEDKTLKAKVVVGDKEKKGIVRQVPCNPPHV